IRKKSVARVCAIPGAGRKTAERLIVELREKVNQFAPGELETQAQTPDAGGKGGALRDDLISALVNLGYQKAAAERAVSTAVKEEPGAAFEVALKRALRSLSR